MSHSLQSMCIIFELEQTQRLLERAQAQMRAELEFDCEPSGFYLQLQIGVGAGLPSFAEAVINGMTVDIGDVKVTYIDG